MFPSSISGEQEYPVIWIIFLSGFVKNTGCRDYDRSHTIKTSTEMLTTAKKKTKQNKTKQNKKKIKKTKNNKNQTTLQ